MKVTIILNVPEADPDTLTERKLTELLELSKPTDAEEGREGGEN